MDKQLKELLFDEQDRGHLVLEDDPEYTALLHQSMALFPNGDLPNEIVELLDISNSICLGHGLKLGLRLKQWSAL